AAAGAADDGVVAAAAVEEVVSGAAVDAVCAGAAADRVGAGGAAEHVVPGRTDRPAGQDGRDERKAVVRPVRVMSRGPHEEARRQPRRRTARANAEGERGPLLRRDVRDRAGEGAVAGGAGRGSAAADLPAG